MMRHGEPVTRLRGTPVLDPYSQEVTGLSWDGPPELPIPGCGIEPRPSSEPTQDARNSVVSGYTVYADFDADVTPADRLRIRGVVYEIEGDIGEWANPFTGRQAGAVIQTKRVSG